MSRLREWAEALLEWCFGPRRSEEPSEKVLPDGMLVDVVVFVVLAMLVGAAFHFGWFGLECRVAC